ncbi:MAG: EamA family transporter [Methanosarcinales archaeon Met12]|nr:MAG: EamA family transporter [Methanosarcinales archaeon Met12]
MIGETKTWAILVVVVCAFLGAIGQIFFKMGSDLISEDITSWLPKLLVGFGLYGLSSILFILALRHGNLTLLYPIIATSFIWTALFAVMFLGESMNLAKWGGIGLILLGVSLIVR